MEDREIVEKFLARDEGAISASEEKYGRMLASLAMNLLSDRADSEECVNDTWLRAWGAIPPEEPKNLGAYLAKITRNLCLDRLRTGAAQKRGCGVYSSSLEELEECVGGGESIGSDMESENLGEILSRFLRSENERERKMFVCRYFYCDGIADIAARFGVREATVRTGLCRTRQRLKIYLEKEGITL